MEFASLQRRNTRSNTGSNAGHRMLLQPHRSPLVEAHEQKAESALSLPGTPLSTTERTEMGVLLQVADRPGTGGQFPQVHGMLGGPLSAQIQHRFLRRWSSAMAGSRCRESGGDPSPWCWIAWIPARR